MHFSMTVLAHTPAPSHAWLTTFPPPQPIPPQSVPAPQNSHAPFTHAPVVPHVSGASASQSLDGSVMLSTAAHCPFAAPVSALLHASQRLSHAAVQQKPSTQGAPSEQGTSVHVVPIELPPTWHTFAAVHVAGATQSTFVAQTVRQAAPASSHA
jgi:hypothetical protein